MKRQYIKPAMQVVKIQQHGIICTSTGAKSLNSTDGFDFDPNGLDEDDV